MRSLGFIWSPKRNIVFVNIDIEWIVLLYYIFDHWMWEESNTVGRDRHSSRNLDKEFYFYLFWLSYTRMKSLDLAGAFFTFPFNRSWTGTTQFVTCCINNYIGKFHLTAGANILQTEGPTSIWIVVPNRMTKKDLWQSGWTLEQNISGP